MSTNPAVTMDAKGRKIIKSPAPRIPDKAEISIEGADELYREIRKYPHRRRRQEGRTKAGCPS